MFKVKVIHLSETIFNLRKAYIVIKFRSTRHFIEDILFKAKQ